MLTENRRSRAHIDVPLILMVAAMCLFGVLAVCVATFSTDSSAENLLGHIAESSFALRQCFFLLIAPVVLLVIMNIPYDLMRRFTPTVYYGATILIAVVKGKDVTKEGINAAMKAAANDSYGYTEEQLVSKDIVGITYGSLFDATQTMVSKIDDDTYQVQVVAWYDNENSYTSQMVRTIKYFAELG